MNKAETRNSDRAWRGKSIGRQGKKERRKGCTRRTSHVRPCNVLTALRFMVCLYLATATRSCDIIGSRHFTGYAIRVNCCSTEKSQNTLRNSRSFSFFDKTVLFLYLMIRKYLRVEHMRSDFSSYKLCINIYGVYMGTLAMGTSSFPSDRQIYTNIYIVSMVFVSVLFLVRRFWFNMEYPILFFTLLDLIWHTSNGVFLAYPIHKNKHKYKLKSISHSSFCEYRQ